VKTPDFQAKTCEVGGEAYFPIQKIEMLLSQSIAKAEVQIWYKK